MRTNGGTRGGAIRNGQFLKASDKVIFRYKSHQTGKKETLSLSAPDFIQRLLQHIMIPYKQTMRCHGLYHPCKTEALNLAREHFNQQPAQPPTEFEVA